MKMFKIFGIGSIILTVVSLALLIFRYTLSGNLDSKILLFRFILTILVSVFMIITFLGIVYLSKKFEKKFLLIISIAIAIILILNDFVFKFLLQRFYLQSALFAILIVVVYLLAGISILFVRELKSAKITGIILIILSIFSAINLIITSNIYLASIQIVLEIAFSLSTAILFFAASRNFNE